MWMILCGCLYLNNIVWLLVCEWYCGATCMWMILCGYLYLNDIVWLLVCEWCCGAAFIWMILWVGLVSQWYCGASCMWTILWGCLYEGRLLIHAHSEIFSWYSKVAMHVQCFLVATTLLHSGAKFHSFLYTGSKTVHVNMESCYVNEIEATCGDWIFKCWKCNASWNSSPFTGCVWWRHC